MKYDFKTRGRFLGCCFHPICVFGVMALLPVLGMNLDSITLAVMLLVIGIIVDDSVIVAERIYQERENG